MDWNIITGYFFRKAEAVVSFGGGRLLGGAVLHFVGLTEMLRSSQSRVAIIEIEREEFEANLTEKSLLRFELIMPSSNFALLSVDTQIFSIGEGGQEALGASVITSFSTS